MATVQGAELASYASHTKRLQVPTGADRRRGTSRDRQQGTSQPAALRKATHSLAAGAGAGGASLRLAMGGAASFAKRWSSGERLRSGNPLDEKITLLVCMIWVQRCPISLDHPTQPIRE